VNSGALTKHPDLVIGSVITFNLPYDNLMEAAKNNYNAYFKDPSDDDVEFFKTVKSTIPCTVVNFMSETYGKYGSDNSD
jgi:hypothetical protein